MATKEVVPVTLESFVTLVEASGFQRHEVEEDRGRLTLDVQGEETVLRLHIALGKSPEGDVTWYTRFLSYSLQFEPIKAGVPRLKLLEWMNAKNADVLFGRYYFDENTDTIAFEVAIPCNEGINPVDFEDMLRVATVSVDRAHKDLKELVEA